MCASSPLLPRCMYVVEGMQCSRPPHQDERHLFATPGSFYEEKGGQILPISGLEYDRSRIMAEAELANPEESPLEIELGCLSNTKGDRVRMHIDMKNVVVQGWSMQGPTTIIMLKVPNQNVEFHRITNQQIMREKMDNARD